MHSSDSIHAAIEKLAALTKREQRDLKNFERGAKYNPVVTGAAGAAAGAVAGPLVYGLAKGFGTGPGELLHNPTISRDAFGMPSVHKMGIPTLRSIAKLWIRSPSGGLTIPAKAALIGAGILGTRTALGPSLSRRAAAKLRRKKAETSKTAAVYLSDNIHDALEKIAGAKRLLRIDKSRKYMEGTPEANEAWRMARNKYERRVSGMSRDLQAFSDATPSGVSPFKHALRTDPTKAVRFLAQLPRVTVKTLRYQRKAGARLGSGVTQTAEAAAKAGPKR